MAKGQNNKIWKSPSHRTLPDRGANWNSFRVESLFESKKQQYSRVIAEDLEPFVVPMFENSFSPLYTLPKKKRLFLKMVGSVENVKGWISYYFGINLEPEKPEEEEMRVGNGPNFAEIDSISSSQEPTQGRNIQQKNAHFSQVQPNLTLESQSPGISTSEIQPSQPQPPVKSQQQVFNQTQTNLQRRMSPDSSVADEEVPDQDFIVSSDDLRTRTLRHKLCSRKRILKNQSMPPELRGNNNNKV